MYCLAPRRLGCFVRDAADSARLEPVLPMPVRSGAAVRYTLGQAGEASLDVFDVTGRRVGGIEPGWQDAGEHETRLDLSRLSNGVYFLRLEAGSQRESRRVVLIH